MIVRGIAWLAGTSLVMSSNAELVDHLFFETFNFNLGSCIISFRYLDPIRGKFILHLDCIMSDRSTTIALRFLPF